MLESHQCGIAAALGLTCKAFFPGCSPEAVPAPAGGAPGVVAEASPEVGPAPRRHPHPHPHPSPRTGATGQDQSKSILSAPAS